VFERQQQQRQLAFEGALAAWECENGRAKSHNQIKSNKVNGGGPSFLPRPSSSFPSDFHAYGSAGAASQTGAAGDDQLLDDDDGEAGGFAAVPDHTKFPTLIPPQKLATVGGNLKLILAFCMWDFCTAMELQGGHWPISPLPLLNYLNYHTVKMSRTKA
jgi:hypothetical protein